MDVCEHPPTRRMQIANVPYCLECKEYLVTGLCGKCSRAIDDHWGIGTSDLTCPKDDGIPA